MWIYHQGSGILQSPELLYVTAGYSGHGEGLNNPDAQDIHDIGPVPRGDWIIGKGWRHPLLGPVAMPLRWVRGPCGEPVVPNGRFGFYIHGDNSKGDRSASNGCIVLDHPWRVLIDASTDRALRVVA